MTASVALEKLLAKFAPDAKLLSWTESAWHSVTFSGSRAVATIDFPGEAAVWGEAILGTIADGEFALKGVDVVEATTIWVNRSKGGKPEQRLTCQIGLLLLDGVRTRDLAA